MMNGSRLPSLEDKCVPLSLMSWLSDAMISRSWLITTLRAASTAAGEESRLHLEAEAASLFAEPEMWFVLCVRLEDVPETSSESPPSLSLIHTLSFLAVFQVTVQQFLKFYWLPQKCSDRAGCQPARAGEKWRKSFCKRATHRIMA